MLTLYRTRRGTVIEIDDAEALEFGLDEYAWSCPAMALIHSAIGIVLSMVTAACWLLWLMGG